MPHASGMTTKGTIFIKTFFSISNEIRMITITRFLGKHHKLFDEKVLCLSEIDVRKRKEKKRKRRKAMVKLFVLHLNAVIQRAVNIVPQQIKYSFREAIEFLKIRHSFKVQSLSVKK